MYIIRDLKVQYTRLMKWLCKREHDNNITVTSFLTNIVMYVDSVYLVENEIKKNTTSITDHRLPYSRPRASYT